MDIVHLNESQLITEASDDELDLYEDDDDSNGIVDIVLYKVQCFVRISGTDKTYNLTYENIYSFWTFYVGGEPVVYIINRKIHGCLEIPDLFLVLSMIFLTRSHPCIILYSIYVPSILVSLPEC